MDKPESAHVKGMRATWPELAVRLLAVIGALTVLTSLVGFWRSHAGPPVASGTLVYEDGRPAVGIPVFLDRGGVIERYVTDSLGRYRLPLARYGRGEAWLICPPDAVPSVGYAGRFGGGEVHETLNTRDVRPGDRVPVRGFGWSAPIPRECRFADSATYWRGPVDSADAVVSAESHEPEWSTYRARP